jgi:hypothetical protein
VEGDPFQRGLRVAAFARIVAAHVRHQGIEHLGVDRLQLLGRPRGGRILPGKLPGELADIDFLGAQQRRTGQKHSGRQQPDLVKSHTCIPLLNER